MFLMIAGFSIGLMIMNYGNAPVNGFATGNKTLNQNDDSSVFEAPWKNAVKTLAMSMGEFNSMPLYDSFDKDDKYSRSIAMIILVLLMMFGNIAMVNLFITVILSDIEELKLRVFRQSIVNMAQYSILIEDANPPLILK